MDPLCKIQTRLSLSHNKVRLLQVAWAHMKSNYLHCGIHWNRKKSCGRPTVKSTWRQHLEEKAGDQWLKTCSKRGRKKKKIPEWSSWREQLHWNRAHARQKKRNKHLEKEKKKSMYIYTHKIQMRIYWQMIKTQVQKFTTFVPKASTSLPTRFCFREYVRTVKEYLIQGYCGQVSVTNNLTSSPVIGASWLKIPF